MFSLVVVYCRPLSLFEKTCLLSFLLSVSLPLSLSNPTLSLSIVHSFSPISQSLSHTLLRLRGSVIIGTRDPCPYVGTDHVTYAHIWAARGTVDCS